MLKTKISFIALIAIVFSFTACEKDDPVIPNEEEVITTVKYTLTPQDGGTPVVLSFQDLDGDGGDAPIISSSTLSPQTTYIGTLDLLNEQEGLSESITEEIAEEDEEHQFFFITDIGGLEIAYDDRDSDGNPIGLKTNLSTVDAGNGTITIILRHEPNKSAAGVVNGDITNAGGETDIEIKFPVNVQ